MIKRAWAYSFFALALILASLAGTCAVAGTGDDGQGDYSFWVRLNLADDVAVKYKIIRVYVSGEDGGKLGRSNGDFDGLFKIVVPGSYVGKPMFFTVEFERKTSFLQSLPEIMKYPLVVGILSSFYYTTPDPIALPEAGNEIVVNGPDPSGPPIAITDLSMGYSEKSHEILKNIPNIPRLFKVEFKPFKGSAVGKTPYAGFVTKQGEGLSQSSISNFNPDSFEGFCGGDDWYLILKDSSEIKPASGANENDGDPCRVWVMFNGSTPRLFYQDITLPALFGVIELDIGFAAIPVIKDTLYMTAALPSGSSPTVSNTEDYVLIQEADLKNQVWDFYYDDSVFNNFSGGFYGGSYKISLKFENLAYPRRAYGNSGFFSETSGNAVICDINLNITGINLTQTPNNLGGLIGKAANTVIKNVQVSGVSLDPAASKNTGGYVGNVDSSVVFHSKDCTQAVASKEFGTGTPTTIP